MSNLGTAPYTSAPARSWWERLVAWWTAPQAPPGCYVPGHDGPCGHEDGLCPSGYRRDGTAYRLPIPADGVEIKQ